MKLAACALTAFLVIALSPAASAHSVKRVTARSICHYEERYFVWSVGERWRVWGRPKPGHADKKVVLQKSKYGRHWTREVVSHLIPERAYFPDDRDHLFDSRALKRCL